MEEELTPTSRTTLSRLRERGSFERDTIYKILDASPFCHVAYLLEVTGKSAPAK